MQVGSTPNDFTLLDQHGAQVRWSSLRGQPVVVFFYPKASTPGCTKEACSFRDLTSEFGAIGVHVIGMSADSVKRQSNFANKYDLTYSLLSDPEHLVLEPWGVWAEKKNYGHTYMGIVRSSFLFDADGALVHQWRNIRVAGHADKVLAVAQQHQATGSDVQAD
jgi:peroxiredoxin Q/BCP